MIEGSPRSQVFVRLRSGLFTLSAAATTVFVGENLYRWKTLTSPICGPSANLPANTLIAATLHQVGVCAGRKHVPALKEKGESPRPCLRKSYTDWCWEARPHRFSSPPPSRICIHLSQLLIFNPDSETFDTLDEKPLKVYLESDDELTKPGTLCSHNSKSVWTFAPSPIGSKAFFMSSNTWQRKIVVFSQLVPFVDIIMASILRTYENN